MRERPSSSTDRTSYAPPTTPASPSLAAQLWRRGFSPAVNVAMTKLAVIGVGHLGRHHARILSASPDLELVGVVDLNQERAERIAGINGTQVIREAVELLGRMDGVVIATPTESPSALGGPFLEVGSGV